MNAAPQRRNEYTRLHREAHALRLFRVLPNGEARTYWAITFPRDPWGGCEHTVRFGLKLGAIRHADEATDDDYAVLDVLNEDGDIVQDYSVPTAAAFKTIKRRLGNPKVERPETADV